MKEGEELEREERKEERGLGEVCCPFVGAGGVEGLHTADALSHARPGPI